MKIRSIDITYKTLAKVIEECHTLGIDFNEIDFDYQTGDYDKINIILEYQSPETDEEIKKREAQEKRNIAYRRNLFEQLKKEFGELW